MIIAGIQKHTLIDYPGKIACIVFLAGCNFRCPWCYSSELVLPLKIANQPRFSDQEFFNFLKERQGLLDGVVVCGGEPTINRDLPKFIEKIKSYGFSVKLDTNGSNPEMLKDLVMGKLVDYVAMDIKGIGIYEPILGEGIRLEHIKESVEFLKKGLVDFEFRTTCVPTIHKKEDFIEIAKWIGGQNVKYYLQNFVASDGKMIDPEFEKVRPFENKFLEEIVAQICPYFKEVKLRA